MTCDFCTLPEVKTIYAARDFVVVIPGTTLTVRSKGGWAACPTCSSLVAAGQKRALLKRFLDRMKKSGIFAPCSYTVAKAMHDGFWAHRL